MEEHFYRGTETNDEHPYGTRWRWTCSCGAKGKWQFQSPACCPFDQKAHRRKKEEKAKK